MKKKTKWLCQRDTEIELDGRERSIDIRKGMKSDEIENFFLDELLDEESLTPHTGNVVTRLGKYKYKIYAPYSGTKWTQIRELIPA